MATTTNGADVLASNAQDESEKSLDLNSTQPSQGRFVQKVKEEFRKSISGNTAAANSVQESATGSVNLDEILSNCRITFSDRIVIPPTVLEITGINSSSIISTLGNFLAVIGKAKSRKTFLVSLLISAFICRNTIANKIKCSIDDNKRKVLLFDTEQSTYHVQKVLFRIIATAQSGNADHLEVYSLRTIPPKLRLEVIKHKIYNTPGVALAVIDGIKDLCFDINDGKEATEITTELMRWSEEANIHIIIVLHQNKGDNNARGHLGTEVINKAETVISVINDPNNVGLSIVAPEFCRDREFEPFAFSVDENGLPYIITQWVQCGKVEGSRTRKLTANQIPDKQHLEILKEMFEHLDKPTYSKLEEPLAIAFQKCGVDLAQKRRKEYLAYYNSKGWIKAHKVEGIKYPVYRFNQPV